MLVTEKNDRSDSEGSGYLSKQKSLKIEHFLCPPNNAQRSLVQINFTKNKSKTHDKLSILSKQKMLISSYIS